MVRGFVRMIILATAVIFIISINSGCQSETTVKPKGTVTTSAKISNPAPVARNQQTSDKAARAVAAENIDLKKQIAAKDKQINAKDKQIAQLKDELSKRPILKNKDLVPKAEMDKQLNDMGAEMIDLMEKNAKLDEENKSLKKQIDELKAVKQN